MNLAKLTSRVVVGTLRMIVVLTGMLGMGSNAAMAESSRSVFLPLIFDSGHSIRTTACLNVMMRTYPQSSWWEYFDGKAGTPEFAFKAMVLAAKNKKKTALYKLISPSQRGDSKRFDQDATQFFKMMEAYAQMEVPMAYEFDNSVVFPVRIKQGDKVSYLIFLFANEAGHYKFLPYGSEEMNYEIVRDWINSKLGLSGVGEPEYCTDEIIKRASHRLSLSNSTISKSALHPSYLYFTGASLNKSESPSAIVKQVLSTVEAIKSDLESPDSGGVDRFIKHLTPDGGMGLKEWFSTASQLDLSNYKRAIIEQHPFYIIDALPLVVVYTKSPGGSSQVMFYILSESNQLLWTHSSYITASTKLFTRGPLRDSSMENIPFASSKIH
jgi:hypothetical protein